MHENEIHSDIFVPVAKMVNADRPTEMNLDVRSVKQITGPACVFPDLGNTSTNAFLRVKPVGDWAKLFTNYIQTDSNDSD